MSSLGVPALDPQELKHVGSIKSGDVAHMHPIDKYFYLRLQTPVDAVFFRPLLNIMVANIPMLLAVFMPQHFFSWTMLAMHAVCVGKEGFFLV